MVVDAFYRPSLADGKLGKAKQYMLLILNAGYKTPGTKGIKVHALTMDNFSPAVLNMLAEDIGLKYILYLVDCEILRAGYSSLFRK